MIQYIFTSLFFFFLVLFAYIKIRYPFWNIQPVFHTYDYWRYFYSIPFIIYKYRPVKTKFCDFHQVETYSYIECSPKHKRDVINLLQCYYISSEKILYTVREEDIDLILSGTNESTYVSLFYEKIFQTAGEGETKMIVNSHPIGCITSRPYKMFYRPTLVEDCYTDILIYMIDYLCVHRERDQAKINRTLLQTHEYNQRIKNPDILVSLLKKEIDLFDGVIPLVRYQTNTYYIPKINESVLPAHFIVARIEDTNKDMLTDFLYNQTHTTYENMPCLFDICIMQDTAYYLSLVKRGLMHIYCMYCKEHVYGLYFYKDTTSQYEYVDGTAVQLVSSIMNTTNDLLFNAGFLHSISQLTKYKNDYNLVMIENIGHNITIDAYWNSKNTPIFSNSTAYYLYNMVYPCSPLLPERCMIIL